ncbi:E3 ubiquitin-protein ligase, partial [Tetrabaena socialis]
GKRPRAASGAHFQVAKPVSDASPSSIFAVEQPSRHVAHLAGAWSRPFWSETTSPFVVTLADLQPAAMASPAPAEEPAAVVAAEAKPAAPQWTPEYGGCEDSSAFECNVCLELAKEPVVTLWWMQVQTYCRACPVCKAGVEIDKVVPIYGRGSEPTTKVLEAVKPVPPRPAGQRPAAVQAITPGQPAQGVLPSLFGFHLGPGQGYNEALTPEQQHQAFLSRLLLMLGSFVIMCLLLF